MQDKKMNSIISGVPSVNLSDPDYPVSSQGRDSHDVGIAAFMTLRTWVTADGNGPGRMAPAACL